MGSTHPPLESLLKLSQNCLVGFELTSLNRIANLRKEFREVLDEWIEAQIEASFARWVVEYRLVRDSSEDQRALPPFEPPQLSFRTVAHAPDQLLLPSGDDLPPAIPFAAIVQFGDSVNCELRSPLRHLPVSQAATAALRTLEHFARCAAPSIGDQPLDLGDFDAPDRSPFDPFFPSPQCEPVHKLKSVSSQMTCLVSSTNPSTRYVVRYASTFVASDHSTVGEPAAPFGVNSHSRSRTRASRLRSECAFAIRKCHTDLRSPSPFVVFQSQSDLLQPAPSALLQCQSDPSPPSACAPRQRQSDPYRFSPHQLSLRQFSLQRTALLLRN
jgi:hypothetical protein